jgi:hypothetical protein
MSTHIIPTVKQIDWRALIFRILAGIVALLFITNLYLLSAPWAPLASYPNEDPRLLNPDLHRWHDAMWGAVSGILEGGVWLTLLWRPRRYPLLIQFVALAVILAAPILLPFEPSLLFVMLPVAITIAAYPNPRAFVDFSRERSGSRPLLYLSAVTALVLIPYMVRLELWQIQGIGGEHATAVQWASDVEHAVFLVLATLLASTKRLGWQMLSVLSGFVFLYLGVVAIVLPNHAGSWGIAGGVASLVGGLLYIGLTLQESRQVAQQDSKALPSTIS